MVLLARNSIGGTSHYCRGRMYFFAILPQAFYADYAGAQLVMM
jgi:hypothetical protein